MGESNKRKSRHSQASPDSSKPQQENQALVCVSNLSAYILYKLHVCLYVTNVLGGRGGGGWMKAQFEGEIWFQGLIREVQVQISMHIDQFCKGEALKHLGLFENHKNHMQAHAKCQETKL